MSAAPSPPPLPLSDTLTHPVPSSSHHPRSITAPSHPPDSPTSGLSSAADDSDADAVSTDLPPTTPSADHAARALTSTSTHPTAHPIPAPQSAPALGPQHQRRLSRRFPSLLARISSSTQGGTTKSAPSSLTRSLTKHNHPASYSQSDSTRERSGRRSGARFGDEEPRPVAHLQAEARARVPSDAHGTWDSKRNSRRRSSIVNPLDTGRNSRVLRDDESSAAERERKMHQTSSRLLRMTDDERPYTRDFKDLFSTLMVSLPLTPHRVRFQRIDHTFTSEEAVTNLGSLKFSQSNRMPDPKDPSRIVTTTTTTTFSMAKEMARSVCTKFLDARFIESVDGKSDFSSRSAVWQLTPKGMNILQSFCQRNGINQRHVFELLASPRNTMNLVLLEREPDGDKIHRDQATIEVVFRRFAGAEPNVKYSTANSDSDSLSEYQTGMIGVKMAKERKMGDKTHHNTFTGKACVDWLMDCCTVVDRRETHDLAQLFCDYGLMQPIETFGTSAPTRFSPLKSAIYAITEKGQRVAGWIASPKPPMQLNGDASALNGRPREGATRDSNTGRMTIIIRDPALRLLFREFLRDTHCEENLSFFLDVKDFLANYTAAKKESATPRLEVIRETLAAAYSLYNAFLAPGSPCELNIDHTLRTSLAARMTRAVGDDEAMIKSLDEVATLFDQAQNSVFKLMASDSVPKFMREQKYASIIRERGLDVALSAPHIAPPQTVD